MRLVSRAVARVDSEHVLLLKGILLLAVVATAFLAAWHYGLLRGVWAGDRTGLSAAITFVFLVAAANGGGHLVRLSRALNHVENVERYIGRHGPPAAELDNGQAANPSDLPRGCVADHIANLLRKARFCGPRPIDQRLLLESFETELRRGHAFGWFVADLLLSLGLLGTVVGFILMLGPIAGLDTQDETAIKTALAAMSGGMAVALYTTLTGLIGGMLLKMLGLLLDGAVDELVRRTTRLTEIHVLPALERERFDAAA